MHSCLKIVHFKILKVDTDNLSILGDCGMLTSTFILTYYKEFCCSQKSEFLDKVLCARFSLARKQNLSLFALENAES